MGDNYGNYTKIEKVGEGKFNLKIERRGGN
jgi:hypothetical protein